MFRAIFLCLYRYQMIRCGCANVVIFCQNTESYKTLFCISNASFCGDRIFFLCAFSLPPPECMFLFFKRESKCALCSAADRCYLKFECFQSYFLLFFHFFLSSTLYFFLLKRMKGKKRMCLVKNSFMLWTVKKKEFLFFG